MLPSCCQTMWTRWLALLMCALLPTCDVQPTCTVSSTSTSSASCATRSRECGGGGSDGARQFLIYYCPVCHPMKSLEVQLNPFGFPL